MNRIYLVAILAALIAGQASSQSLLAPSPPMGWNSWDAYGLTINEAQYRANVDVLAGFKKAGWTYAVIDDGWFLQNPEDRPNQFKFYWDANGRLIPDTGRFPSAANNLGFKPLADWVHSRGLKFGIHILRGIPKGVVNENLPVADSTYRAADAADTTDTCPWSGNNYGVRNTPAGQAYYDSVMKQYARWGVDFLKVDCISDHPYKGEEIRMISDAIRKSGRGIVLSLSPGPTNLSRADEVAKYAEMWRITDDIWDGWSFPGTFPNGLLSAFDRLPKWAKYVKPGDWPDADMLPWGSLTPHPGWGRPRQSRLTKDEQRTQFALWSVARSPLMLGGNLTSLDEFTRSLIGNKDVIAINQTAVASEEISGDPADAAKYRVWLATGPGNRPVRYLAVFNLQESPLQKDIPWPAPLAGGNHAAFDIWNQSRLAAAASLHVDIPAHGCALIRVER